MPTVGGKKLPYNPGHPGMKDKGMVQAFVQSHKKAKAKKLKKKQK